MADFNSLVGNTSTQKVNIFEELQKQRKAKAAANAKLTLSQRPTFNPAQRASDEALSFGLKKEASINIPSRMIGDENRPTLQFELDQRRIDRLTEESEAASRFLTDPVNAELAYDDLNTLGFWAGVGNSVARGADATFDNARLKPQFALLKSLERALANEDATFGDLWKEGNEEDGVDDTYELGAGAKTFENGVSALARLSWSRLAGAFGRDVLQDAQADVLQTMGDEAEERADAFPGNLSFENINRRMAQLPEASGPVEGLMNVFELASDDPTGFASWAAQVAAESVPGLVAATAVTAVTRSPGAGAAVMGGSSGVRAEGSNFNELAQAGGYDLTDRESIQHMLLNPEFIDKMSDQSFTYGLVVGVIDGLSGGIASQQLVGNASGEFILQMMVQATMGSSGEALGRFASDQEIDWTEVVTEGIVELVTGPIEIAGVGGRGLRRKIEDVTAAKERRKVFEAIADADGTSTLKGRSAKKYGEMVGALTKDGPVETMYVAPEQMEELFQSNGTTADEFFETLPDLDIADYERARNSGHDFEIPTAVYAANIVGSKFEAGLRDHLKFGPMEMSMAEAQNLQSEITKSISDLETSVAQVEREVSDMQLATREAYEDLTGQLRQAGRTPEVAAREALPFVRFAETQAARSGVTVEEFLKVSPLPRIVGDDAGIEADGSALSQSRKAADIPTDGVSVSVSEQGDMVTLNKLVADEAGTGRGTAYLSRLVKYADSTGKTLALTPTKDFGGNVSRLKKLYARFGFKPNKGANKTFETQETMVRSPDVFFQSAPSSPDAFKEWAGTDKVLDPDEVNYEPFTGQGPWVMRAYHGTTHDFEEFDASVKGTKEGQFGAVNYFSTSEADSADNYGETGPDLTNRIENTSERIEQEIESLWPDLLENASDPEDAFQDLLVALNETYDFDTGSIDNTFIDNDADEGVDAPSLARRISETQLKGGESKLLEVFIRTEKPFVVGSDQSPFIEFVDFEALQEQAEMRVAEENDISPDEVRDNLEEYDEAVDEARWEIEAETPNELYEAIENVASRSGIDGQQIMADLSEMGMEGTTHAALEQALRGSEGILYAEDPENGDLIGHHVLAEIIEELGFDSIILKDADARFSGMNIEPGTAHVHVFDSHNTNIKSVDNAGTFDRTDADIYAQDNAGASDLSTATESEAFKEWFGDSKVVDKNGEPLVVYHGSEQAGFTEFNTNGSGKTAGTGAFFTASKLGALTYSGTRDDVTFPTLEEVAEDPSAYDIDVEEQEDGSFMALSPEGYEYYGATVLEALEEMEAYDGLFEAKAGNYAVYLKLENPWIVDAKGRGWSSVGAETVYVVQNENGAPLEEFFDEEEANEYAKNHTEGTGEYVEVVEDILDDGTGTTDDIAREAREAGADGVIFENITDEGPHGQGYGHDDTVYVVFDANQIKSVDNHGGFDIRSKNILYQNKPGDDLRGRIIFAPIKKGATSTIQLFETADLSTVLHEGAHFFLRSLQTMALTDAPHAKAELEILRDWWLSDIDAFAKEAGVTSAQAKRALKNPEKASDEVRTKVGRAAQEWFARGFEKYALEGKAPSNSLRAAFESFMAWITASYRDAKALNIEINDEVRAVFDRLLATDAEIDAVREENSMSDEIARVAKEMGVDPETYGRLVELSTEARDEAKQSMLGSIMAPIRAMRKEENKRKIEEITAVATDEVMAKKVNRVVNWLAYGEWHGGEEPGLIAEAGELRLDPQLLADEHGAGVEGRLPRGRRPMTLKGSGVSADDIAGYFGYATGADMINDIVNAPKMADEIKALVDARVADLGVDPMDEPGGVEQAAVDAMHGDKRGQLIVAELRAINRLSSRKQKMTSRGQATAIANEIISRMTVRDALASHRYLAAERKFAEQAARLLAEGNTEAAFEAKRKQLLNHALYAASRRTAETVSKTERLAGRLRKRSTRKNLAGEYLEAIDEILVRYDFRKLSGTQEEKRGALAAYIDMMKKEGRDNELAIPDKVLNDVRRKPYKTLPVRELEGVRDSLMNIEHTARMKQKLRDARDAREMDAVVDELNTEFEDNIGDGKPPTRVPTRFGKIRDATREYVKLVENADTILRRIAGWENDGAAPRHIKAAIDAAEINALEMREKAAVEMEDLYKVYTNAERLRMARQRVWKGYDQALSKWDIISIALNSGNKDNYERLTSLDNAGAFTGQQVDALLSNLDARDWDFVQSVWDHIDTYWVQIAARERRTTGVVPKKVEASMQVDAPGRVKGGYYPIVYSPRFSAAVTEEQAQELFENMQRGRFGKAQTSNGHTKERGQGGGGRVVELGMHVFHGHVSRVIHDLAFSEAVNNTWKILQDPRIKGAFEKRGMLEDHRSLEMWVQDVAAGQVLADGIAGRLARHAKAGFTISKLAFNFSTVMLQVTGLPQSAALIGKKNMAKGIGIYASQGFYPAAERVLARSAFMRNRQDTFQKDIYDLLGDTTNGPIAGTYTKTTQLWMRMGFWAMMKTQFYTVDIPTWMGAYEQGLSQGMDDTDAGVHADRMVARAQASGLFADRAAIERGTASLSSRQSDVLRLFTTLASYMFAKFNVASEVAGRTAKDIDGFNATSIKAAANGIFDFTMLFTLEAVLYAAIKGNLPDPEDDDEGWATFLATETALSGMSTLPFIRDISSVFGGFGGGGGYGGVIETIGRAGMSAKDALPGGDEADVRDLRALIDGVGIATPGFPSSFIKNIVDAELERRGGDGASVMDYLLGPR